LILRFVLHQWTDLAVRSHLNAQVQSRGGYPNTQFRTASQRALWGAGVKRQDTTSALTQRRRSRGAVCKCTWPSRPLARDASLFFAALISRRYFMLVCASGAAPRIETARRHFSRIFFNRAPQKAGATRSAGITKSGPTMIETTCSGLITIGVRTARTASAG
jgi:hypothetical protein